MKATPSISRAAASRRFMPFLPQFHDDLRTGRKTLTCRSEPYGDAGDVVDSPVGPIRLTMVLQVPLGLVGRHLYRSEGLASPAEFVKVWNQIHPRKTYREDTLVWLHELEVEERV